MKRKKEIVRLMVGRYFVQGFFLLLFAFLAVRHQIMKGGPTGTPPLDAYCPLGGLVGLYNYVLGGGFIHRLNVSNFVMLAVLVLLGLTVKSAFCGWICPFGTIQEWLGRLGRRLRIGIDVAGSRFDRYGRYVKYIVLAVVVVLTAATGTLVFRAYDPFLAFFHFGFGELEWTAYAVLGLVVVGSLFIVRFWCRYFCPLAVVVGLLGKLGLVKVECENENCVFCYQCEKLCPMDVPIAGQGRITSVECNSCLECLAAQDIKNALSLKAIWGGSRLKPVLLPVTVILLLTVTIAGSQVMGLWRSKGGGGRGLGRERFAAALMVPALNVDDGDAVEEKPTEGRRNKDTRRSDVRSGRAGDEEESTSQDKSGKEEQKSEEPKGLERVLKVGDREVTVMGYMSLEEVAKAASVPVSYLVSRLGLPESTPQSSHLGRLGKRYGFTIQDVRSHLRTYIEEREKGRDKEQKKGSGTEDKDRTEENKKGGKQ